MYKRGKNVLKINNRVSAKFIPVNFEFFHQTCLLGTNTLINFFDFFSTRHAYLGRHVY